jgi:hypothetical protein
MEQNINLPELTFYDFADTLGLIEKSVKKFEPTDITSQIINQTELTLASFNPMVVALYNGKITSMRELFPATSLTTFKNIINSLSTEDWRELRLTVALYSNNNQSYQNFEKSKVLARADIDKPYPLEELILKIEDTFGEHQPNILHRTYKGWHLFWLADEFIERKDRHLIENFVTFLNKIKFKNKATWIDRIDLFGAMTRIVNNDLKSYVYNPTLYSVKALREFDVKHLKSNYDYIIPDRLEFEDVLSHCSAYQTLDNTWETHSYRSWLYMSLLYAAKYILAESVVEKKKIYEEFIEKSLTYPNANLNKIKKQFQYSLKWVQKEDKLILPSCRALYISGICEKCPIFREKDGHIVSHPFRDSFKFQVNVDGFVIRNGRWYAKETDKEGNELLIEVCKEFKILKVLRKIMPSETVDYLKVLVDNKTYIVPKENKADAGLNLSSIANIIPIADKRRFRNLIEKYLYSLSFDKTNFIEVDFVGYRKRFNVKDYEYVVANENVSEQDLFGILYGYFQDNNSLTDYIPAKKGSYEKWKEAYIKLFKLQEPLSLYLVSFSLSHLLLDWYKETTGFLLTPIIALKGQSRVGKTKRSILSLALYGKPKEFSFGSITEARIKNQFGVIKTPIIIDEVVSRGSNFEKMRNLLYHIANASVKADAYKTAPPITVPIILTGEPQNFNLEKLFQEAQGLIRRVFTVLLKKETIKEDFWNAIDHDILPTLTKNYGWIFKHLNSFKTADLEGMFIDTKKVVDSLFNKFKGTLYEDHLTQITLSFVAFKIFYRDLGISEDEINETMIKISEYLLEKTEIMSDFLASDNSFEDFILDTANKLKEALSNRKELSGITLSQALTKSNVSLEGLDKEESSLMKLCFGKRYSSGNYYYANNVLIDTIYKESDINRLLNNKSQVSDNLWNTFVELYKSLILKKYDYKTASDIFEKFASSGLPEFTLKKNKTEVKEPEIEPEDVVDF